MRGMWRESLKFKVTGQRWGKIGVMNLFFKSNKEH